MDVVVGSDDLGAEIFGDADVVSSKVNVEEDGTADVKEREAQVVRFGNRFFILSSTFYGFLNKNLMVRF